MRNSIDQKKCSMCKLCIEICPNNVIGINSSNEVSFIPEKESICIKCGQCMAICRPKAIQIEGITYEKDLFDLPESGTKYKQLMNFIANRRSVRNFKDQSIPKEILKQILDSIHFAPFGASPEEVHITVVSNRKVIKSVLPGISEFYESIPGWIKNPIIRSKIKSSEGLETFNTLANHVAPIAKSGNYKLKQGDRITRNAPAVIIFHAEKGAEEHTNNSLIYAVYAILAAQSLGLGATMVGLLPAAINKLKDVKKKFQIPNKHEAVMSVILGYPEYKYTRAIRRDVHTVNWIE
ncbi:MAG: nitroreductase family protein [Spirochaetes bacterium]|nr:nitroreductase family protein [Spirochaetota bacterium]